MDIEQCKKVDALKKAYAEIILNTAQEAAARVLDSERRALRFKVELRSNKDESLRLLLRFKQMIDAKTTEASISSLNQQKKIDELQAQLDETEEMILDLRAELNQARDQLEKMKNNHVQRLNERAEKENKSHENMVPEKKLLMYGTSKLFSPVHVSEAVLNSEAFGSALCEKSVDKKCYGDDIVENPNMTMTSLLLKSQEPDLHENGCAQRMRAILGKLVNGNSSIEDHMLRKNDSDIEMDNQHVSKHSILITKTECINLTKKPDESVMCINRNGTNDHPVIVGKTRKTRTRYGKGRGTSCRLRCNRSMKQHIPASTVCCCKRNLHIIKDGVFGLPSKYVESVNTIENHSAMGENARSIEDQAIHTTHQSVGKRKVKSWDDLVADSCRNSPQKSREFCQLSLKSKKELMTNPEDNSSLRSMNRNSEEKRSRASGMQKHDYMDKISDGQQLMQVAQQLISLSGKRWM